MVRNAPMVMASIEKNCLEHISLMAQEQIELEFREELQQMQQHKMGMQQNPQMQAAANTPEMQQIHAQIQQTKDTRIKTVMGKY